MKKFRKARCPHCGNKLSLLQSWTLKTQGEYKCPKCGGYSNIELDSAVYIFAIAAIVLSGLIYLVWMISVGVLSLVSIFMIMLPYFLFYLLCFFLVRLRKPTARRKPPAAGRPQPSPQQQTQKIYDRNSRRL
ncbi:hypothetical protein [Caproiciproducens faecalis]|uniref:Cxxc_20_cxxc protein n=1 Tax=Caproiciproducens faecalis TaxID=2820301 RepID=A0ABS7DNZ0_9FIRM|nr:hypothetical protein [Caproiciproducens faecalis]MBW7572918.1 hypothetical protein [Caproiciproducens faecalis]